ncbi:hypothetical protein Hanom_Chr00s043487g01775521 [Helianthus anomalus]
MELKWVFKVELSILIVSWKHTLVSSRRVRSTLTRTRTRTRSRARARVAWAMRRNVAL